MSVSIENLEMEIDKEKMMPLLGNAAIAAAIKSGNVNIAGAMRTEVLDLSEESQEAMLQHAERLRKFEAQQRARSIIVPTAIEDIKKMLRELGHPATLFGENHADRRERLREVVANLELKDEEVKKTQKSINETLKVTPGGAVESGKPTATQGAQKEVFYSPASETLIAARKSIAEFSCNRSTERIIATKRIRASESLQTEEDRTAAALYMNTKDIELDSSQFADDRPLTAVRFAPTGNVLASGSLTGMVKLWDYKSLRQLSVGGRSLRGHEERITALSWHPTAFRQDNAILASSSADGTCLLWDCRDLSDHRIEEEIQNGNNISSSNNNSHSNNKGEMDMDDINGNGDSNHQHHPIILQKLVGHQGVVSDCDFHPNGRLLGTAGLDYSWRLWDVETGEELLLQDGHIRECGTISFQADGALVLTADWAGVALVWDLRSGQVVHTCQGHVKKIVTSSFSPNGFQVATAGADHMVRIWDLRKKKCGYALPAHSNLISDVRYSQSGELLVTSSFDGTVKVWRARDFEPLRNLSGHTGKVMSCDISPDEKHFASAGYDRTLKKWTSKLEEM